jgi:hypothetical protein
MPMTRAKADENSTELSRGNENRILREAGVKKPDQSRSREKGEITRHLTIRIKVVYSI